MRKLIASSVVATALFSSAATSQPLINCTPCYTTGTGESYCGTPGSYSHGGPNLYAACTTVRDSEGKRYCATYQGQCGSGAMLKSENEGNTQVAKCMVQSVAVG